MKIGIILNNLGASQLAYYVIRNINEQSEASVEDDCTIFFENMSPLVIKPLVGSMNTSEIWNFDGTLISTSFENTISSLNAATSAKRYFYVWDLEWLRPHGKSFERQVLAYADKDINLIARSEDHAKAIWNYCNRDVCGIVDDFNIEQLMEVIK